MFDPFGDFETAGYLRNVYGYKDKARVSAAERMEVASNAPDAATFLLGKEHSVQSCPGSSQNSLWRNVSLGR